jgi:hypothetical protein
MIVLPDFGVLLCREPESPLLEYFTRTLIYPAVTKGRNIVNKFIVTSTG